MDLSLFPKGEEWGSGDEAMDNKLTMALKSPTQHLSPDSIRDFYLFGVSLKPRTFNPAFSSTIENVTSALFHHLNPNEFIDHAFIKMLGDYPRKELLPFKLEQSEKILKELFTHKTFRYQQQIDFFLNSAPNKMRNPYVSVELNRSGIQLTARIIFKDFKKFLNEETKPELFTDPFFSALKGSRHVLFIESFAKVWYHQDQLFVIGLISP